MQRLRTRMQSAAETLSQEPWRGEPPFKTVDELRELEGYLRILFNQLRKADTFAKATAAASAATAARHTGLCLRQCFRWHSALQ